jgi:hypothetical protein
MLKTGTKYYFPKLLVFRFTVCHKDTTAEITQRYQGGCEKANLSPFS